MQLTELRTFLAIVETGSLVRASEHLNVTQSTVTARLKSLEAELGQILIRRQKSGASLTAAGVKLHKYAATISDLWRQARQETALPDGLSSVCNVGCHPDLWHGVGDRVVNFVSRTVPDIGLSVSVGGQSELTTWLNDGLIDLSISFAPGASQSQQVVSTISDRLVLVSTDADSPIKFDPNYIFVEAGEQFAREHSAAYSDADTARISFNTACAGLDYLLTAKGSAYLPERMVSELIKQGKLFQLHNAPLFTRNAYLSINNTVADAWYWLDDCLSDVC